MFFLKQQKTKKKHTQYKFATSVQQQKHIYLISFVANSRLAMKKGWQFKLGLFCNFISLVVAIFSIFPLFFYSYELGPNGTCVDIDECKQPGTCSQFCTNEIGTYKVIKKIFFSIISFICINSYFNIAPNQEKAKKRAQRSVKSITQTKFCHKKTIKSE